MSVENSEILMKFNGLVKRGRVQMICVLSHNKLSLTNPYSFTPEQRENVRFYGVGVWKFYNENFLIFKSMTTSETTQISAESLFSSKLCKQTSCIWIRFNKKSK